MKQTDDYKKLVEHWNKVFQLTDEESEEGAQENSESFGEEEMKQMAPSEKLFDAAVSLKDCSNVLDYGCGNGWAGIIAAKSGSGSVTFADPAENAIEAVKLYAKMFGISDRIKTVCIDEKWINTIEERAYDGLICSNVLDVIPPEMAENILKNTSRILKEGSRVIIGMNNYLSPDVAKEKGLEMQGGNMLYIDGILRLVSRTDEEWSEILGKFFKIERLEHFAWPGETKETRRLFYLTRE
ncbi:MAG: class I SAM-dependent methyltransferase [Lachnospiraceae bacterium]|nr:class I SAM-dependent methyltransferase [Lachnospiraceae bacterium]